MVAVFYFDWADLLIDLSKVVTDMIAVINEKLDKYLDLLNLLFCLDHTLVWRMMMAR